MVIRWSKWTRLPNPSWINSNTKEMFCFKAKLWRWRKQLLRWRSLRSSLNYYSLRKKEIYSNGKDFYLNFRKYRNERFFILNYDMRLRIVELWCDLRRKRWTVSELNYWRFDKNQASWLSWRRNDGRCGGSLCLDSRFMIYNCLYLNQIYKSYFSIIF